ncbi:MAG: Gfo/Idh/MocA family oxidoreductase [Clostridium sp.]|nr:Gfo/Idh/MocA family oxidoreductase [Clostridium sp.]
MIGVAILGAGDIANIHIEAYQQFGQRCHIVALADIFTEKAQEKKEKYGLDCDVVGDYRELLERDDIQLVSVCLPPSMHCETSVAFLERGIHVLCEKPMAPCLEECDRMLAAAKAGQAKLSIVAQNRFKQDIMKTKALLDQKALGDVYFVQANSTWWRGDNYYDLWWRGTWEKEGGGCTFIHAVHHIDLLLWLMGDVKELSALVSNQNHHNSEVEDVSISTIRFRSGAVGVMTANLLHHGEEQRFIIDAEKGTIEIPHKLSVSRQQQNGYPEDDVEAREALQEAFRRIDDLKYTDHCGQIENMLTAIEQDTDPLISGEEGRKTLEFISAVYQSAFTGQTVKFPMTSEDLFYTKEGILSKAVKFHEKTKSVSNYADTGIKVGGTL